MATTISVPFTVMNDTGIRESYDTNAGAIATVKFKCAWNDHYTLVQELTGTATLNVPPDGNPTIITQFPYAYPGSPNLFCRAIESVEPFGRPMILSWLPKGAWLARKEAIVTARFSYFPYQGTQQDASGKPYTTTSLNLSGEMLTLPNTAFRFADGTFNNVNVGIPLPQMQISMQRQLLPYLPIMEMLSILGQANVGPFQLGNFIAPTGTVLFCGGASQVTVNTDGTVIQTVTYQFLYRALPWGWGLSPKTGLPQPLINVKNGNPAVPLADFSILP